MCGPGMRRNYTAPAKTVTDVAFQGFFVMDESTHP